MEVRWLLWDDHNIEHIARHKVTPAEVEQVVFSSETNGPYRDDRNRPGRLAFFGRAANGRPLVVVTEGPTSKRRGLRRERSPRQRARAQEILGGPMTETDPRADERAFYDNTDYSEIDLERADDIEVVRVPGPRSTFAIRLDGNTIEQLREVSRRYGTRPTQIAREWLVERLEKERQQTTGPEPRTEALGLEDRVASLETRLNYYTGSHARGTALSPGRDIDVIAGLEAQTVVARELIQRLPDSVSVEVPADPGADLIVRAGDRSWVIQFKSGTADLVPSFKHLITLAKRLKARPVLVSLHVTTLEVETMARSSGVLVTTPTDLDDLVGEIADHTSPTDHRSVATPA